MHTRRCFHNWRPGLLYSPAPLRELDLVSVYMDRLAEAVKGNVPELAAHLKARPTTKSVINTLLSRGSSELKAVVAARAQKVAGHTSSSSAAYASFLRELYSAKLSPKKLAYALKALAAANGGHHSQPALRLAPAHLEQLINRSMDNPLLFPLVFELLEKSKLPMTARELATNIWHTALQRGNWRDVLATHWPTILASNDTGAFNLLLKTAFKAHCRSTQSLVQYHLRPDRFTYLLRLQHDHNPQDVMREFRAKKFVTDIVVVSAYMSALLIAGHRQGVTTAESVFDRVSEASMGVTPIVHNHNRVGNCLTALDTVNQVIKDDIELPLIADARLCERMYLHYAQTARHGAAVNTLRLMAHQGHIPPRHDVRNHIHKLDESLDVSIKTTSAVHDLFYLCCDLNMAHPGYMSDTLALEWAKTITRRTDIKFEDAEALVARNRALVNN